MFVLLTLFSFLLLITLVVAVHEYGHYCVARLCGVKVLQFSIGFGRPLWRYTTKTGMEFRISWLPLGGYVKMLGEGDEPVPAIERPHTFNGQSIPRRLGILVAGPAANFLFAIILYWIIATVGVTQVKPIIGEVKPQSIAAKGGLQKGQIIKRVDGQEISSWQQVHLALLSRVGDNDKALRMTVAPHPTGISGEVVTEQLIALSLQGWQVDMQQPDLLNALGLTPYVPLIPPTIAQVIPGGPAAVAGLQVGDQLLQINGQSMQDWRQLLSLVKKKPGERVTVLVKNESGKTQSLSVLLGEEKDKSGAMTGYLGVQSPTVVWPAWALHVERYSPLNAIPQAVKKTVHMTKLSLMMLYKMLLGRISTDGLSGPIGIAQWAGQSMAMGWMAFASFMALVNVSLGLINLLPIPLLDGGHMAFCLIEALRGKPLSLAAQGVALRVGLALLMTLMVVAVWNDLLRL